MDRQPWHNRLNRELSKQRVPTRLRLRYLAELQEHAEDLMEEENMQETLLEERLGNPENVAQQIADECRRSSWTRRHPLVMFGLLPIPVLLGGMCATILFIWIALGLPVLIMDQFGKEPSRPATIIAVTIVSYLLRFVPFVMAMVFFTRRYLRSGVNRRWYALGAVQVLFFAVTFFSNLRLSDELGQSQFAVGFAWMYPIIEQGLRATLSVLWKGSQFWQLLVPVLCAGAMFWKEARHKRAIV